jgi:hypothetical protein
MLSGVQLKPLTRSGDRPPIVLQTREDGDLGHVMVWIEAESDERFVLGPAEKVDSSHGEILLF